MLIFKKAHDLSFLDENSAYGKGAYGIYYGAFPKHKMQEIREKLGIIDPNIGVKVFRDKYDLKYNIEEMLVLYFIFPELNKLGIETTYTNQPLSIVNVIYNRFIPVKHVDGVSIYNYFPSSLDRALDSTICRLINNKISSIGVKWNDCHSNNYLMSEHSAKIILDKWQEFKNEKNQDGIYDLDEYAKYDFIPSLNMDLLKHITIIDPGQFRCEKSSPCGLKIQQFESAVLQSLKGRHTLIARRIREAFDLIFQY